MLRFITALIAASIIGLAVYLPHFLSVDDLKECRGPSLVDQTCAPANAIVAISGGDTSARVIEAIKLYNAGWAPVLIFSGAALDKSGPSNAEAMRKQALAAGIPESAIILETEALDTKENAFRTSALLSSNFTRIILVTSPYHQRRAGLEFQFFLGERITIVNHPTPYDRLWPEYWWTTRDGWWLALSEGLKTLVVVLRS